MSKLKLISCCLFLLTAIYGRAETGGLQGLPATSVGANLAPNPGFEEGTGNPAHWNLGSAWKWVQGDAANCRGAGPNCLSVTGTSSATASYTVKAGARAMRFRAWIRTAGGDPGSAARFYFYLFDRTHNGSAYACGGAADRLPLAGGRANWTEYTLCDDISNSPLHYGDDFEVRMIALNIPSGVTLYVDDVSAAPVLQPLVVFPIYPNYRGMLWPDQGNTIRWNAAVEPPDPHMVEDLRVAVDLVRAQDGVVLETLTKATLAPVAASGANAGYSVNPMSYDAADLPNGSYLLRGRLLRGSDGTPIYTYPDYKIVKEEPARQRDQWKVWIDKDSRTVIKGKPRFVHGAYFTADSGTTQFVTGAADCCRPATADNHRQIALGCVRRQIKVTHISNSNPAIFTVPKHNLRDKAKITLSGATGSWANANGCYYWIGCRHGSAGKEIARLDENRFSAPIDTTQFGAFAGQDITMVRDACYEDDIPLSPGDTTFGAGGSSLINVMKRTGMNVVIRYGNFASANGGIGTPGCDTYTPNDDHLTPWLSAIQDADAWHLQIVNHYLPGNIPMAPGWWGALCTDRLQSVEEKVRWMINRQVSLKPMGNSDGFLGLYVADEPRHNDHSQGLPLSFDKVHEFHSLNFGGASYWATTNPAQTALRWNAIPDAHGADPYPAGAGPAPDDFALGVATGRSEKRHGRSYAWPRVVSDALFDSRPNWTVIQLWRQAGAWPSLFDHKIQIVSALAAGSHGILWWQLGGTTGLSRQGQAEYLSFEHAAKVLAGLAPILSEPIQDLTGRQDGQPEYGRVIASVSDPDIKCASRRLGTSVLLSCANTTNIAKTVTLRMTNAIGGSVELPWEGTTIAPNSDKSSFTAEFKGLLDPTAPANSVHLFLIRQIIVVNTASLRTGAVSPGELISLFGPALGPSSPQANSVNAETGVVGSLLAGTRLLFDQFPAPLLLVAPNQINGIVPYGVAGQQNTNISVEHGGATTATLTSPVVEARPGIFTTNAIGTGQAVAINEDGTLNSASNPASKGSIVVIFVTGAGLTDPAGVDGQIAAAPPPAPVLPVAVRIAGIAGDVLFAGGVPGVVAGIFQLNLRVPEEAPAGASVPVTVVVGDAEGQPGVTLAVQ